MKSIDIIQIIRNIDSNNVNNSQIDLNLVRAEVSNIFGSFNKLPLGFQTEVPKKLDNNLLDDFRKSLNKNSLDMDLFAWESQFKESLESNTFEIDVLRLMSDLIGTCATRAATEKNWNEFSRFIKPIDVWGFLPLLEDYPELEKVTASELGTLVDLTLLTWSIWGQGLSNNLQIVEIGGGYGRLAHALFTTFPTAKIHYFLVDAIPSVMVLAAQHLRNLLGEYSVDILLDGNYFKNENTKVNIIPAWNHECLNKISEVEILINIESFQEMGENFVKFWFDFAEHSVSSDGFFYISNSRSYINRNPWPISSKWIVGFQMDVPRMWTLDHPTAVLLPNPSRYPNRFGVFMKLSLLSVWKSTNNILIPEGSRGHRFLNLYLRIVRFLSR